MTHAHLEHQDALKVDQAVEVMPYDQETARRLLGEVIRNTPDHYDVRGREGSEAFARCWTIDEFNACIMQPEGGQSHAHVTWRKSAYPRAFYWLAHLETERHQYEDALANLSEALRLEPDHPDVLHYVGVVRGLMGDHERALEFQEAALTSRPYMSATSKARILRGLGVTLIDHGRLDDAETRLKESLAIEGSQLALDELAYIEHLRGGGSKADNVLVHRLARATPSSPSGMVSPNVRTGGDRLPGTATTSISVTCPACSRMASATLYPVVNVTLNPELKLPLLQQKLTRQRCAGCGTKLSLIYDLLYCDADSEIAIRLLPGESSPTPDAIEGCSLRRVVTLYHLIEKVGIADRNLDDRAIELLKHEVCYDLAGRYSDLLAKFGMSRMNPANVLFVGIDTSADAASRSTFEFLLLLNGQAGFDVFRVSGPASAFAAIEARLRRETPLDTSAWHAIDFPWAHGVLANESIPVNVEVTWVPGLLSDRPLASAISNAWNEQVQPVRVGRSGMATASVSEDTIRTAVRAEDTQVAKTVPDMTPQGTSMAGWIKRLFRGGR